MLNQHKAKESQEDDRTAITTIAEGTDDLYEI